jgi:hypothetical protein
VISDLAHRIFEPGDREQIGTARRQARRRTIALTLRAAQSGTSAIQAARPKQNSQEIRGGKF